MERTSRGIFERTSHAQIPIRLDFKVARGAQEDLLFVPLRSSLFFLPFYFGLIALIATRGINFPLRRRHAEPLIGHGISLRVIRRRLIVACAAGPGTVLTRRIRPLDPNQSLVNAIGWVG